MKDFEDKIFTDFQILVKEEPLLYNLYGALLHKQSLWALLSTVLEGKIHKYSASNMNFEEEFHDIFLNDPEIRATITADIAAYHQRDFACKNYLEVILFHRGFQAVTMYRIARHYHLSNQKYTARFFQNCISESFCMDIHPNAKIGKGVVVDHGIGLVVGETAEIGDHVYILHNVTLGSTGHHSGDRHPKVKDHVFIGAGAIILGNIVINEHVNIAAGSVVTKDVASYTTVAGVPARPIGTYKKLQ